MNKTEVPASPCGTCPKRVGCHVTTCKTWEAWFSGVWRRIRKSALGKDD